MKTSRIIAASASATEGKVGSTKIISVPVTLSTPSPATVAVKFATADGTAKAGTDYTASSGTLSFAAGQTSKFVPVTNGVTESRSLPKPSRSS